MMVRLIKTLAAALGVTTTVGTLPAWAVTFDPVVPGPALISVEEDALVLEFSNACKADAGIRLTLLSAGQGDHYLVVESARTLQACPEIYQPVRLTVTLPNDLSLSEDRVFARRPADGQPEGQDIGTIDAELLRMTLPHVRWTDARKGQIAVSANCGTDDIEARFLPESVTPGGTEQGYIALPPDCVDPDAARDIMLDADRPAALLNPSMS